MPPVIQAEHPHWVPVAFDDDSATHDPEDEMSLVHRAAGDPDAFAALYRRHVDAIHAFAWRRTGRRDLAEDITAATFERALRNLSSFRWQGTGSFRRWLFRLAANESTDHHRREARHRTPRAVATTAALAGDRPSASDDVEERALARSDADRLRVAFDQLPERYARVLSLRYLADLSPPETADALGLSRATCAVITHRATRALRRIMEEAS